MMMDAGSEPVIRWTTCAVRARQCVTTRCLSRIPKGSLCGWSVTIAAASTTIVGADLSRVFRKCEPIVGTLAKMTVRHLWSRNGRGGSLW